jgi:predicted GH43/DUF377 family glycosyl hydrolase
MEPQPGNEQEAGGVLNPAAVRGADGNLYLFPRIATTDNFSRIGIARVLFDKNGNPSGVERLGIALEPQAEYELRPGGRGCEDPRVTFVAPLGKYLMSYTAFSAQGPRIAMAESKDLIHWVRLGLVSYSPYQHIKFNGVDNKDACFFPAAIPSPHDGRPSLGFLHRPLFPGTRPEETSRKADPIMAQNHRECIWISYSHLNQHSPVDHAVHFSSHHPLAAPQSDWDALKVGAGAPPVETEWSWLFIYHGVSQKKATVPGQRSLTYSAGIMILSKVEPGKVLYRSPSPVLQPELEAEKVGIVAEVVFPTGVDQRLDIGKPNRFDLYYGMADDKIGVASLELPDNFSELIAGYQRP